MVTPNEITDLQNVTVESRLNGEVMQHAKVSDMIFSIPRIISYISTFTELVPGDVIIEFDNKEIKFSSDLPHVVGQIKPDSIASAKVIRDGKQISLDFVLGELPINNETFIPAKTQSSSDPIGLKVVDIDRDNPSMANMPDGVIVSRVNPNSAASGKVNRGDIITMIQYKGKKFDVNGVDSFNEALNNFSSGNKIAIHLIRNGSRLITSITLN